MILGFMLFFIIVLSLYTSTGPVPYSKDTLFSKEFPYEGMTSLTPENIVNEVKKRINNDNSNAEGSTPVEGFQGLQSAPYGSEQPLDKYSQLSGSKTCTPSPYSNSQGYLCLDEQTSSLLSTRGANSTSGEGNIGSPKK
jgi:hypothetical protein